MRLLAGKQNVMAIFEDEIVDQFSACEYCGGEQVGHICCGECHFEEVYLLDDDTTRRVDEVYVLERRQPKTEVEAAEHAYELEAGK